MPGWGWQPGTSLRLMKRPLLLGLAVALVLVLLFYDGSSEPDVADPPSPATMRDDLVPAETSQVIVVTTETKAENKAQVAAFQREGERWEKVGGTYSARIAPNGFVEDATGLTNVTPSGGFRLTTSFGRVENPGTAIPYRMVEATDCWITDGASAYFNDWVSTPTCASPNIALLEPEPGPYELAIVTDFNAEDDPTKLAPLLLHRHKYSEGEAPLPTTGSVSLQREDLLDLLLWLDPASNPVVVLGVSDWLTGAEEDVDPGGWTNVSYGDTGPMVADIQQALTDADVPTIVDGRFLEQTQQSVRSFQDDNGLPVTGVVDEQTARELGVFEG